jgi:nicotinate-nucleotide pyrophosphorylase
MTLILNWLQRVSGVAACLLTAPTAMAAKLVSRFESMSAHSKQIEVKKGLIKTIANLKYIFLIWRTYLNITTCISGTKMAGILAVEWIKTALTNTPNFCYKAE